MLLILESEPDLLAPVLQPDLGVGDPRLGRPVGIAGRRAHSRVVGPGPKPRQRRGPRPGQLALRHTLRQRRAGAAKGARTGQVQALLRAHLAGLAVEIRRRGVNHLLEVRIEVAVDEIIGLAAGRERRVGRHVRLQPRGVGGDAPGQVRRTLRRAGEQWVGRRRLRLGIHVDEAVDPCGALLNQVRAPLRHVPGCRVGKGLGAVGRRFALLGAAAERETKHGWCSL